MAYRIFQQLGLWALIIIVNILFHTSRQPVEGRPLELDAAATTFSVDAYGANGDGISDDSQAFLAAWKAACKSSSSSVFLVPQGKTYLVNPIKFQGPCQASSLIAQISGTIVAPDDPATWPTQDEPVWLKFSKFQGIIIQGGGTIDGSGQKWWANSCKTDKSKTCKKAPTAMIIASSVNVILRNLNFQNSQQIHLSISSSTNVQVESLQIVAPGYSPNTDGIHITASQHVVIQSCTVGTGDDCVSIVTGSSDISINQLVCGPGHGISIGSLGKDDSKAMVSDVVVDGAFLTSTANGLRTKTWQGGSGYAQGIIFQNVKMNNVSNPIIIDQYYCDSTRPCPIKKSAVQVNNVTYRGISGTSATEEAITLACSETVPCQNIVMENIELNMDNGDPVTSVCENVNGFSQECLGV